jgi:hypothetical protein
MPPDWYCQHVGYYTSHCIFQRDIAEPYGWPGVVASLVFLALVVGAVSLVVWLRRRR